MLPSPEGSYKRLVIRPVVCTKVPSGTLAVLSCGGLPPVPPPCPVLGAGPVMCQVSEAAPLAKTSSFSPSSSVTSTPNNPFVP